MNIKDITLKGEGYISTKIPIRLLGSAEIIQKDENDNKRIIAGYANLAVVDSQNQLITTEALKSGLDTLMSDPSYANLMLYHRNIQIGKILSEYGELTTHVDDKGLYIVAEIRKDTEIANDIWEQIINGEVNGFSIGCEVVTDPVTKCDTNGENCIEILNDINIFEVSVTNFPANEMSGFVVVSKSKYNDGDLDLSTYENVCDECGIDRDIMSKKKAKSEVKEEKLEEKPSETEEEKSDEVELSDAEKIEKLERDIFNIQALLAKLNKEEEKSDEPEKTEETKEEKKEEEKTEEKTEPESEPEPEKKSDADELKTKIDDIAQGMSKLAEQLGNLFAEKTEEKTIDELKKEIEELNLAVKSRDDELAAKDKKLEVLTKSSDEKEESKTLQETDDNETVELEDDDPFVHKDGEMYLRY